MTQKEIAERLSVSQTTVSFVLNNPGTRRASQTKRRQILDLMRQTNYMLKAHSGRTWCIGHILDQRMDVNSEFYRRFRDGIQKSSFEAGYKVVLDNDNASVSKLITNRKVDGVILEKVTDDADLQQLAGNIPTVLLNDSRPVTECDTVAPDDQGGISKAISHLLATGHSRIAFLGAMPPEGKIRALLRTRRDFFIEELNRRGVNIQDDFIKIPQLDKISLAATERMVAEALSGWRRLAEPPDAVVCGNDLYAALLLRIAAEKKFVIPDQLSVIGTDNSDKCEFTYPNLTSIDHNAFEMGRLAVELLLKRLEEPERPFIKVSCDAKLVIRKSTRL